MTDQGKPGRADNSERWPAPAKLNLFLHITGRRDDGYHLLQTVFQLLDYGDELAFVTRPDHQLTLTVQPPDDSLAVADNLVMRAALLLQQLAESHGRPVGGADITLYKNLPAGAGLGGGSSDAATTLVALNYLWKCGFGVDELAQAGVQLGADIPVFIRAQTSWAEGIGEILQPVSVPQRWFVVINPAIHVATSSLFARPELTRDCTPITIRAFQSGAPTSNVFEPLVCRLQPGVQTALDELRAEARHGGTGEPRMTGTGSGVFVDCESQARAQKVLNAVLGRMRHFNGFVARGVEHSALIHYT